MLKMTNIKINIPKDFLIKEYVGNLKSTRQIAKIIGCDKGVILRNLKKYNIKIRKGSEAQRIKYFKILTKQFLEMEYLKNKKSPFKIANVLKCSETTIRKSLIKFNIPRRTLSEANKLSKRRKGIYRKVNAKTRKTYYCIEPNCNNEITYHNFKYGQGRCRSCASKKMWQNPDFSKKTRQAILYSCYIKPNKTEKYLKKLILQVVGNDYKFVGNGELILDGLCPDFVNINGQKKIIELYGDYWHNLPEYKKRDKRRIKAYANYGYKTLIIWEHELKDIDKVKNRILEFNNA